MKPFEQLTYQGKARRLRRLVINALDQYALEVTGIQLVGLFTNSIFRLRTRNGRSYVMRICNPTWRTKTDLISEIMWLQALSRDTDIRVPQPIPTKNDDFIVESSAHGVPESRRCVVMSWVPGILLGKRLNEVNLYKMGELFARLHNHGAHFKPPAGFTKRKMDSIYARDEADILLSEACHDAFTSETRSILLQTNAQVKEAFAQLYLDTASIQVIHNDLHHDNINIYHGNLYPLDFEDTIWGYPVQDIAMALQDLMTDVAPDKFESYQNAFRAGYESCKKWPECYQGQIDTFRAGRMLWVANYVARFESQYLREHIEWLAPQFKRYLETGKIRKM